MQEAFLDALRTWPTRGVPPNPSAWIITTARNRAIDRLRRKKKLAEKTELLEHLDALERLGGDESDSGGIPDDRLRLIFTCCHPALPMEHRVALTLRTLGGLTTREIAKAFLVAETAMAQRLVRAKKKIKDAGIPYRVPPQELLPERLPGVLAALYLIFNEGYGSSSDSLVRVDLCDEAIRLTRVVVGLMPDEPEPMGLLALMLLQHSRRETRVTGTGDLVLLEDQDRTRWDGPMIAEGLDLLETAMGLGRPGSYQIQAAIAAAHARAARPEDTDWPEISTLYGVLLNIQPSPVVALNRAVAVAMADGPAAGLAHLEPLEDVLREYHFFHAAKADLLRRLGRLDEATAGYSDALLYATNPAERKFLEGRLAEVTSQEVRDGV